MRPDVRRGALILALLASPGLAFGQTAPAPQSRDDITGSLGPAAASRRAELVLSDEQRGQVFDSIMRLQDAPTINIPAPPLATALPGTVPLQDLPAPLAGEIPALKDYKFVKLDDRILLVEADSRVVITQLPRYRLIQ